MTPCLLAQRTVLSILHEPRRVGCGVEYDELGGNERKTQVMMSQMLSLTMSLEFSAMLHLFNFNMAYMLMSNGYERN